MLVFVSKIVDLPVVDQTSKKTLGKIKDWVIDPDKGKVMAWQVSGRGANQWLSTIDVLEYRNELINVRDEESLQKIDNLVRVKELSEQPVRVVKMPVMTDKGEKLGKVNDFILDTSGHFVAKIVVSPSLFNKIFERDLIIPRDLILKITRKEITVRYDEKAPVKSVEPEIVQ